MTDHQKTAAPAAPAAPSVAPDLTPPTGAKAGKAPKEPKAAKEPKEPKAPKEPRVSNYQKVYPETATITVVTEGGQNPKREGSKARGRFDLYAANKTVGEYIKAGGTYSSLSWDVGHGFIKVG